MGVGNLLPLAQTPSSDACNNGCVGGGHKRDAEVGLRERCDIQTACLWFVYLLRRFFGGGGCLGLIGPLF